MKFRILLHKEVVRNDSRHFDYRTKNKIKEKCLTLLSGHPEQVGESLHGELAGYRKLKVFDDYRVVYRVDRRKAQVLILAVGIRRNEEVYVEALKRLGRQTRQG